MHVENSRRFDWRVLLITAAVACVAVLYVIVYGGDFGILMYVVGVAGIGTFALLVALAVLKSGKQRVTAIAVFLCFVVVTAVLLFNEARIRTPLCWMLWSQRYKREVLALPDPKNGEFRHVEWDGDGWGGAPVGDWMGYLIFDPNDSLRPFNNAGVHQRADGIPCKVVAVRRLEKQWYSVVFDMNEFWGRCGSTDTVAIQGGPTVAKQVPRGLKSTRDDKQNERSVGTTEVVP
jgi:hypothetical protein